MPTSAVDKMTLAYVIGLALGDGNLSNPNGRAVRLRITCDTKYPKLIARIVQAIERLLPQNRVAIIHRARTFIDISCYSNHWEQWLGWRADGGPKHGQRVRVPRWIMSRRSYQIQCLRGLLETDGSYYIDRGYPMVNFVTTIPTLARDMEKMVTHLGFTIRSYKIPQYEKIRHNMRISKNVEDFVKTIAFKKE